ncbi:hypothetical protein [Blastococcus brunescens]|uniref:Winged helix-turn-helix domain-containing protein n=1 Tax=Blastococcus brunescens TaxID=1564165 RepID=A0ABZ1B2N0_9ACTN|nr:hypothetical protein [Blastococcus sp. BMG 8361]WRL63295.1 hypothetical protein U6N30_26620 [Blastococcus sp. BMG 8361]
MVADRLAGRRVLLLLDNLERVLASAGELSVLLARCPRTQLLVTSRSLLRLRGSTTSRSARSPSPGRRWGRARGGAPGPGRRALRGARAAGRPGVRPRSAHRGRRRGPGPSSGGLPLAIELVAARVRTMPPARLLRRLDRTLDLRAAEVDVPDRQRTLRATVAWSHDLLDDDARALLARLSVCSAGATIDTAEAVGAVDGDLDVPEVLSTLVGHSLVAPTDTGEEEPRFRMLEVVRAFAAERLRERGEETATRERWARHLATVSAAAGEGLSGPDRRLWLARLDAETADLQDAVRWAVATDRAGLAVALTAPLARWWWARGLLVPMAEVAEQTARLPSAADLSPDSAALLRWACGTMRIALGRVREAAPLLATVVEDARRHDDPGCSASASWRWP